MPPSGHTRRSFLGRLLALAATGALASEFDIERLLWVPGAKTILLPSPSVAIETVTVHLSHFVTPDWIAAEVLKMMERNLAFSQRVNKRYDDLWRPQGRGQVHLGGA